LLKSRVGRMYDLTTQLLNPLISGRPQDPPWGG
jgi:hypothetical protein